MNPATRIGDAERDRAASVLADHYAAGRLDHGEYLERLDAVWTARTRADLDALFHDLPRLAPPAPPPARRASGRPPWPVMALLFLVAAAVVLTHLPLVLLVVAGVLVFKATRRRGWASGARSGQHDPYRSGSRHW